jgi:hypothetical protein
MKEGSLFCSSVIHPTKMLEIVFLVSLESSASDRVLGIIGKLLTRRGAWAWFHDIWTCCVKVFEN